MPILNKATSDITVTNTVAETTVYSFSVPGGTLSTDNALILELVADIHNNTDGNQSLRLRVKYGATTLYDDSTLVVDGNAVLMPLNISCLLAADGSTASQVLRGSYESGYPYTVAPTAGVGDLESFDWIRSTFAGTATEDSTGAKTLAVTVELGIADTAFTFARRYAVLGLAS